MRWRREHLALDEDRVLDIFARNVVLARGLEDRTRQHLVATTTALIEAKRWEAVGLDLTDEIRVTVAANAAVPVLVLGLDAYRQVSTVIVNRTTTVREQVRSGPVPGVVSAGRMATIGLASHDRGPVLLSWDAVVDESRHPETGRNVVIHEFAHKIDSSDGYSDGVPPSRRVGMQRWVEILSDEYQRAEPRPSDEVLRPYAWNSPAEFFAVACEAYFCTPVRLRSAKPTLYGALFEYFRVDPTRPDLGI